MEDLVGAEYSPARPLGERGMTIIPLAEKIQHETRIEAVINF